LCNFDEISWIVNSKENKAVPFCRPITPIGKAADERAHRISRISKTGKPDYQYVAETQQVHRVYHEE